LFFRNQVIAGRQPWAFLCVLSVLCGSSGWAVLSSIYNHDVMKNLAAILLLTLLTACNNSTSPSPTSTAPVPKSQDPVQQKLLAYSGPAATDCGRLDVHATADQSKAASDCAMQASQAKHAFHVAYDMPGMSVGVAGNPDGKLFTVQAQGSGAPTSGDCPSQLRVASSGRVTCFAPGDMGSMAGSHAAGAMPQGVPNPHAPAKPE
jgi:hypothetical protein